MVSYKALNTTIGDIKEYGTILLVFLTNGNSNILLKIIYVF